MEKQFDFIIPNTGKLLLIWVGGLLVVLPVAIGGSNLLDGHGANAGIIWLTITVIGGIYILYRLSKQFGSRVAQLVITPDNLLVLDRRTGQEKRIAFDQITAYRFSTYNGAEELRLKLADGSKQKIGINNNLHDDQSLTPMVQEFEVALSRYRQQSGEPVTTLREKPSSKSLSQPLC